MDGCYGNSIRVLTSLGNALAQLENNTSTYNQLETVVLVIILGNVNDELADDVIAMIADKFLHSVAIGYFQVIQERLSPVSADPAVCSSRNRSPDVASMALVRHYVAQIADNYLHVGHPDDVVVAPRFVDGIRQFSRRVTGRRRRVKPWTLLSFGPAAGSSDLTGTFVRSPDLLRFAAYLSDFYAGDVSASVGDFLHIVWQRYRIVRYPALFGRHGDEDYDGADLEKPWPDSEDPPALLSTSMRSVGRHSVELFYGSYGGYFRASSPVVDDFVTLVFDEFVFVSRIKIRTGLPSGSLPLVGGVVESSSRLMRVVPSVRCVDYVRVGELGPGVTEFNYVTLRLWGRPTRCLRLTVTATDGTDVVFHQIAVESTAEQ